MVMMVVVVMVVMMIMMVAMMIMMMVMMVVIVMMNIIFIQQPHAHSPELPQLLRHGGWWLVVRLTRHPSRPSRPDARAGQTSLLGRRPH